MPKDDPNKILPGDCGCGEPEIDSDGDGTSDCIDGCPDDPDKTEPGLCGCGVSDTDSDGDGVADCQDGCPGDPDKTVPGVCGCGTPDDDSDGDGAADCVDQCPADPDKTEPGLCGCGVTEFDIDGDGIPACIDNCIGAINPDQFDCDGDGVGDACDTIDTTDCNDNGVDDGCEIANGFADDVNGNGLPDECDLLPCAIASLLDLSGAPDDSAFGGSAVALEGNLAVVGAPGNDDFGVDSGCAYVFHNDGNAWQLVVQLCASVPAVDGRFGAAVALHGNVIVVTERHADDSGSVHLFEHQSGDPAIWTPIAELVSLDIAPGDQFGAATDLHGDTLIVGAPFKDDPQTDSGAVYLFRQDQGGPNNWGQLTKLIVPTESDARFGADVAMSAGNGAASAPNGSPNGNGDRTGAVYAFSEPLGWIAVPASPAALQIGDEFGSAIAIDGETMFAAAPGAHVDAPNAGRVYVFRDTSGLGLWQEELQFPAPMPEQDARFGAALALQGDRVLIAAPLQDALGIDSGTTYLYEQQSTDPELWTVTATIVPFSQQSDDQFGTGLGLQDDVILAAKRTSAAATGEVDLYMLTEFVDCNGNGDADACEIMIGTASDSNDNGVPDECEFTCLADIAEGDSVVNVFDLLELLANWGTSGTGADIAEPNDVVNVFDLLALLSAWGACE